MATLFDAPAEDLIEATAAELADDLEQPDWAQFAKTGTSRELPPEQEDFWALRGASLLRKVADRLATAYGDAKKGSTRYRVRPNQKTSGSKKVIRTLLQQLEDAGYVTTRDGYGREVTGAGRQLLDETATELIEELDRPELERYA
jgi:small subunit ribosomal protein S19e